MCGCKGKLKLLYTVNYYEESKRNLLNSSLKGVRNFSKKYLDPSLNDLDLKAVMMGCFIFAARSL